MSVYKTIGPLVLYKPVGPKKLNNIQSDLIYLLTITVTFVSVIGARGQTQFLFLKHSGCPPN